MNKYNVCQLHPSVRSLSIAALSALLAVGCASTPEQAGRDDSEAQQPAEAPAADADTGGLEEPDESATADAAEEPSDSATTSAKEDAGGDRRDAIRSDAPQRYTVNKGDTLWGIAERFLEDPWLWPEVWYVNPQVDNPHLIYPGDVIRIVVREGARRLTVDAEERAEQRQARSEGGRTRLQPKIRKKPIEAAIPTIPLEAILQFLSEPRVVGLKALDAAPYVLGPVEKEKLIAGTNDLLYVRGLPEDPLSAYQVVREDNVLEDPETGEKLGYEVLNLGRLQMTELGDPATGMVRESTQEIFKGDKLLPTPERELRQNFTPQVPATDVEGRIISIYGEGVSQLGQFDVVTVNLGEREGLSVGDTLAIFQAGGTAEDPVTGDDVELPNRRAGIMLVFRTYERVSYGLVMRARRAIHVMDVVRNP